MVFLGRLATFLINNISYILGILIVRNMGYAYVTANEHYIYYNHSHVQKYVNKQFKSPQ